jgi:hypothetical protein
LDLRISFSVLIFVLDLAASFRFPAENPFGLLLSTRALRPGPVLFGEISLGLAFCSPEGAALRRRRIVVLFNPRRRCDSTLRVQGFLAAALFSLR